MIFLVSSSCSQDQITMPVRCQSASIFWSYVYSWISSWCYLMRRCKRWRFASMSCFSMRSTDWSLPFPQKLQGMFCISWSTQHLEVQDAGEVPHFLLHHAEQSWYRHLWYLVPQIVVFALADPGLPDNQKENMAKTIHSLERSKPHFPVINFPGQEIQLPDLPEFVSSNSLLVFDKKSLVGSQDWLTIPPKLWNNFNEFR